MAHTLPAGVSFFHYDAGSLCSPCSRTDSARFDRSCCHFALAIYQETGSESVFEERGWTSKAFVRDR